MNPVTTAQKCVYCDNAAMWSLIYLEGKKYLAVCPHHETRARTDIKRMGSGVDDRVLISLPRAPYEDRRMASLHKAAPRLDEKMSAQELGQRVTPGRSQSLGEAPAGDPVAQAIAKVRGSEIQRRTDPDFISRSMQKARDKITNKTPKTFLQRMGQDWTTMRARNINGRVDLMIDGDRYTVYSKRG